jgi:hypothetical protein
MSTRTALWVLACFWAASMTARAQGPGDLSTPSPRSTLRPEAPDLLHVPPPALGLFCRLDRGFEKRLPMPLHIRLGDARMVDHWEGHGPGDHKLWP